MYNRKAVHGSETGKLKYVGWPVPWVCIHMFMCIYIYMSFPCGSDGKSVSLQGGRPRFSPWVKKIPWRRKWQPTPVLLPGKLHGWRNLVGYSLWGCKELDTTKQLRFHFLFMCVCVCVCVCVDIYIYIVYLQKHRTVLFFIRSR